MSENKYFQILTKGLQSSLDSTPIEDGKLRYVTDTGRLYLDDGNKRIRISDIIDDLTEEEIGEILVPLPKIYVAKDTGRAYIFINDSWVDIGPAKLEETTENKDIVLWISDKESDQPKYNEALTYNPATKTFKVTHIEATDVKVGNMIITNTLNEDNTTHTVRFSFA